MKTTQFVFTTPAELILHSSYYKRICILIKNLVPFLIVNILAALAMVVYPDSFPVVRHEDDSWFGAVSSGGVKSGRL